MKIISFGSMNIDRVYQVEKFVLPGETIHAEKVQINAGGKGLNQSIAAARAGIKVIHAGIIGEDGRMLTKIMKEAGVDISPVQILQERSGEAVIEVEKSGNNRIIVYGGTNQLFTEEYIDRVLKEYGEPGDIVLLQNEVNLVSYMITKAHEYGMKVAFNPSPIPENLEDIPLEYVDYFILNEIEGMKIAGTEKETADFQEILKMLTRKYPKAVVVLTLGKQGVLCAEGERVFSHNAYKVNAVDTTAAGDTFCGYFLAGICRQDKTEKCLKYASAASAIAVSRKGAAPSIPGYHEIEEFIEKQI